MPNSCLLARMVQEAKILARAQFVVERQGDVFDFAHDLGPRYRSR
jgi:hypothetical protein